MRTRRECGVCGVSRVCGVCGVRRQRERHHAVLREQRESARHLRYGRLAVSGLTVCSLRCGDRGSVELDRGDRDDHDYIRVYLYRP